MLDNLNEWYRNGVHHWSMWDMGLFKFAIFLIGIGIALAVPALSSIDWYWYILVGLILYLKPLYVFFNGTV